MFESVFDLESVCQAVRRRSSSWRRRRKEKEGKGGGRGYRSRRGRRGSACVCVVCVCASCFGAFLLTCLSFCVFQFVFLVSFMSDWISASLCACAFV